MLVTLGISACRLYQPYLKKKKTLVIAMHKLAGGRIDLITGKCLESRSYGAIVFNIFTLLNKGFDITDLYSIHTA